MNIRCCPMCSTLVTHGEGPHGPSQKNRYKHSQNGIHAAQKKSVLKNNGIFNQA